MESKKGFKLLPTSDFHLGSTVTTFISHRLLTKPIIVSDSAIFLSGFISTGQRLEKTLSTKYSTCVATIEGELGILIPVDDRTYRRLLLLQQIMASVIKTTCGLNPREFRYMRTSKYRLERKRGFLDGTLLWAFIDLDCKTQDELCAAMGTTCDAVYDSFYELDLLWSFF